MKTYKEFIEEGRRGAGIGAYVGGFAGGVGGALVGGPAGAAAGAAAGATAGAAIGGRKSFDRFRKTSRNINRRFPGVTQFISVANRWVLKYKRFQNKDLKKVLRVMKRNSDISNMPTGHLKRIYRFIEKYNLYSLESMRHVFADYSDFTKRSEIN